MAISKKKAVEAAKMLVEYCRVQRSCQNCIFRKFRADHWGCNIEGIDLNEVMDNYEAKKRNHGYI